MIEVKEIRIVSRQIPTSLKYFSQLIFILFEIISRTSNHAPQIWIGAILHSIIWIYEMLYRLLIKFFHSTYYDALLVEGFCARERVSSIKALKEIKMMNTKGRAYNVEYREFYGRFTSKWVMMIFYCSKLKISTAISPFHWFILFSSAAQKTSILESILHDIEFLLPAGKTWNLWALWVSFLL